MLQPPSQLLRAAVRSVSRTLLSPGVFRCPCRNVSVKTGGWRTKRVPPRYLGQPSPYTHPHLIKHGEVTPGLTQTEFELRRQRLASLIQAHAERLSGSSRAPDSTHVVIVLSHPIRYMTNDIPYPFHQNQDFLYLTGILEPDSALVMFGSGRPDKAVLFVPRRDPARELWDGPRSGRDGAAALTGLERVHCTEELGTVLKSLKGGVIWVRWSQPCHPRLHPDPMCAPWLEGGAMPRSSENTTHTHSLRASAVPGGWAEGHAPCGTGARSTRLTTNPSGGGPVITVPDSVSVGRNGVKPAAVHGRWCGVIEPHVAKVCMNCVAIFHDAASFIFSKAFKKTMAICRGDIDEALIYAKCRAHGANFLAYPPVVAGGNRANTLHYINNNQIVKVHLDLHLIFSQVSTLAALGHASFSERSAYYLIVLMTQTLSRSLTVLLHDPPSLGIQLMDRCAGRIHCFVNDETPPSVFTLVTC
ncbi:hypothetical protein NFI96_013788 [Prochilodus magdalenae]|nr:hypothetical protein NFI96_013788 [Prochilodus magdalenae]